MSTDQASMQDPAVQAALDELRGLISERYPDATFTMRLGEDPVGVYLIATVDTEDSTEVIDLVIDRLLQMQIEERLPIYVVPVHTPERVSQRMAAQRQSARAPAAALRP